MIRVEAKQIKAFLYTDFHKHKKSCCSASVHIWWYKTKSTHFSTHPTKFYGNFLEILFFFINYRGKYCLKIVRLIWTIWPIKICMYCLFLSITFFTGPYLFVKRLFIFFLSCVIYQTIEASLWLVGPAQSINILCRGVSRL